MTSELDALRSLADRVHPPTLAALEEVARRRTRRTAATAALGCALSVVVVAFGVAVATAHDDHSSPGPVLTPTPTPTVSSSPSPTPSPTHSSTTSMTPEEVVTAEDATLRLAGVSADDPDFRVAVWEATCHWCPKGAEARSKPSFRAMAITSDGYATATLRKVPFDTGLEHVESAGPGLLLIVDAVNGYEWLVRDDGTLTPLSRDFDEVTPADPGLWFTCLGNTGRTGPGGQATPFDVRTTSCALDPDANTVHIWQGPWAGTPDDSRSMVHPGRNVVPWGVRYPFYTPARPAPEVDRIQTWWEVDGVRHHEDFGPLGPADATGPVLNAPPGVMASWYWRKASPKLLTVVTSSDEGDTWQSTELSAPFRPDNWGGFSLAWTPGGDLVGRQNTIYPDGSQNELEGLRIWRADVVDGGEFAVVYEAGTGNETAQYDLPFTVAGDRIWASRLWSDDDGRTWEEVTTWRP